eukprot:CAMPEP_0181212840 /NCGR_PEP_ID=MMETSP1096-20121128/24577_1 /TAXON_ID=156174 ORGANISM="Chrysochromulina ericina, Strain CCMP281" /NCGR_SAMPLE_ID=MMETSP1096 /ASSEMBLY_ACC=CAM_ASM_000453 /LENGTH=92 /DNA_ID=CAMNT_0023304421 /DNA_START=153 /DNA_END=431 /DNA_ORIENTATION=-
MSAQRRASLALPALPLLPWAGHRAQRPECKLASILREDAAARLRTLPTIWDEAHQVATRWVVDASTAIVNAVDRDAVGANTFHSHAAHGIPL